MELTWEEWKAMVKLLRRRLGATGWTLLIYYVILNVSVYLWMLAETLLRSMPFVISGDLAGMEQAAAQASESGWGYFLAAGIGMLILLLWKKPRFWKEEIWAAGSPMRFGSFMALLTLFLGCQLLSQIMVVVLEIGLNSFGMTISEGLAELSMGSDSLSMFLYGGILAPVTEEILFRGLIQRSLMPYGKKFAILCSAFTFGLFHGNLIQIPYAFLAGLILGYTASEYSIGWAMLLHMINNLVLGDALNRLTSGLPDEAAALILWGILLVSGIAALVILIGKRKKIRSWLRQNLISRTCMTCFFSSVGMIVFMLVMAVMTVWSTFVLITPLS